MSLLDRRAAAVRETVDSVRRIEGGKPVDYEMLEKIGATLIGLASQTDLFPIDQFPVRADGGIYRLSEDGDHRYALYASAGLPGKLVPPHNHTTWAVISGVHGKEHNVRYDRVDNRATPGQCELRRSWERTIEKGNCITFLPDDFHTIQVTAESPRALHLHLYGLSLEHLPERITVNQQTGAYRTFPEKPKILTPLLTPTEVKAMLGSGEEMAFFDVREEGEFSTGHPLFAYCLPLSRLETRVAALLPDPAARIVLMDGGDEGQHAGRANRAAARLQLLGFRNVAVMDGGLKGWREAGFEVFSGINVPSKSFGEFVEHECDTPRIEASELKKMMDEGRKMVVLDSRPIDEFRNMSIPTAADCPGAELVYRVRDYAPDPDTLVVVNCAGRTRSIIGAQSLINAGVPNKVVALKNGTMGWHLAGLQVDHGKDSTFKPRSAEAAAWARQAAEAVAKKAGVTTIDKAGLAALQAKGGSLFRFDVRDPSEYATGHLKGFVNAPGGQLVQATDRYVGVRNATIVLHDDDGVRATMTAHWLVQMGWSKAFVLKHAPTSDETEAGAAATPVLGLPSSVDEISAPEVKALLDAGKALVVDLATSLQYRDKGHIPGAWFAIRAHLARSLPELTAKAPGATVVFTSPDGVLSTLAAADAAALGVPAKALKGGTPAWTAAGHPLEKGATRHADKTNDVWYRPYDRTEGVEAAMNEYLVWEVDLISPTNRDGDAKFRVLRP